MYPAGQNITVRNNGIGLASGSGVYPLVIGVAKGLSANSLAPYTDPTTFLDDAETGPIVETVLASIAKAGGVLVLALAASVAGVISSVTADRAGSSTGTVAVTGTSQLELRGKAEITRTGAKGVGRFRYTLDGKVFGSIRTIPAGGTFSPPGTDLVLTFTGTAGLSAVTQAGGGPALTVTGTPLLDAVYVITVSTGGTNGTGQFGVTKNGVSIATGVTIPTTPFTYVIPGGSGVTATFGNGTHVLNTTHTLTAYTSISTDFEEGDTFSFTTTAPSYSTTDLAHGIAALKTNLGQRKIKKVVLTGRHATTSAGAIMAAALATQLSDLEGIDHYVRCLMHTGDGTAAQFLSSFSAFADERVALCFSEARCAVRAPFEGYGEPWQPNVRVFAERAFEADLSENLGRKASGNLSYVTEIAHDEGENTAFTEADKVNTLRTYRGETGFFCTNGYLRSPAGSDFLYWDWGCTIDVLCDGIVEGQSKWLLAKLRSLTDGTGHLDKNDAIRIEDAIKTLLRDRLTEPQNVEGYKGHVSALNYAVNLANNFLSTREVVSTGSAVPLAPVEGFITEVGLTRSI